MRERHELAKVIATDYEAPNKLYDYEMERLAETILAAGYRKQRTVATIEELEDARESSVFLAGDHAYRKERGALVELGIGLLGYAEVLEEEGSLLCVWEPKV